MPTLSRTPTDLAAGEVNSFLTWQFGDIARRPEALTLRETAAVVSYLRRLRIQGIPKEVVHRGLDAIKAYYRRPERSAVEMRARHNAERVERLLWAELLQFGNLPVSSKTTAKTFLRRRASDLSGPWLGEALKFLEEYDLPPDANEQSGAQRLVGRQISIQGDINPYLQDDLSERIAAADYALKRAGIRARRRSIARALNDSMLTPLKDDTWGADEVRDRVRAYERQHNHLPIDFIADKWVALYHSSLLTLSRKPGD